MTSVQVVLGSVVLCAVISVALNRVYRVSAVQAG